MQRIHRAAGFTLIELLVVIGILSLLIAALAPAVFSAAGAADKFADKANMTWHYQVFTDYYNTYNRQLPRGTGAKFIIDPWVRKRVQRTQENFERYWTPGLPDDRKEQLLAMDLETVWTSPDEITSFDTQYAGPSADLKRQRLYGDGKLPMMANDNEFAPAFSDHTINVLMGGGDVRELLLDPDLIEFGFNGTPEEGAFAVGPESPHPLLQQLEK